MPKRSKGKNQREDWNQGDDWLEDEAESSTEPDYVNNNNGVTGRNGEENHNDRGGRRDRKGTNSQSSRAIEPVTQAARDTSEILSQALKEIEKLNTLCAKCADDIEAVANTHQKYRELQEQCKEKDVKIDEQKAIIRGWGNAINDIEEMSRKEIFDKEEEFGNQLALFEEEKKSFEKSKKTLKAEKAEQEHKLNEELKKLKEEQDKKFKTRLDNLEKSIKQREDANEKKLKDLEAHNKKLVESLTAKESKIVDLDGKVKKIKERKEEQIMLKNSFKDEKEGLQKKLAAIENEFGMTSQTTDFYQQKFAEISRFIEDISFKYFKELSEEMIDKYDEIQKMLIEADDSFAFIPISRSEASEKLRIAHAQRIISSSLYDNILQTFSSEKMVSHPQSASLLSEIVSELSKTYHTCSGRSEGVCRTLIIRALRSLQPDSPTNSRSISQGSLQPMSMRASQVLQDIFTKLSPLIIPEQESDLRKDVLELAQATISVWTLVQTDKMKLVVSLNLEPAESSKWRSPDFDPSSSDDNNSQVDITSSNHPRIFTLFPRVTAQTQSEKVESPQNLPGNWPESHQEPGMIEFDIHSGIGLRDCSALVLDGKAEVEEKKNYLEVMMKQVRMGYKTGRVTSGSIGIRGSLVDFPSGPSSPSAIWGGMRGGKVTKE